MATKAPPPARGVGPSSGYVVLALLLGAASLALYFGARSSTPAPEPTTAATSAAPAPSTVPADDGKLQIEDLVTGTGEAAAVGDTVSVHYAGTLLDGSEFDASRKHHKPFDFKLGQGRVIKGWDQGVVGMKVGGKRKLTIPPSLGYGSRGAGTVIPPNSTLVFVIDLLEKKKS